VSEYPAEWVNTLCAWIEAADAKDKTKAYKRVIEVVLKDNRRSYDVIDAITGCAWAAGASESYCDDTLDPGPRQSRDHVVVMV
jgi:hypothetical protein